MKKKRTCSWLWWIACVLWLGVIFGQSHIAGDLSEAESQGLLAYLVKIFPFLTEAILRKLAHFGEFAILGLLLSQCLRSAVLPPLFVGLLCAMCDETIQIFVVGRASMVQDVWIDFAGVTAAVLLIFVLRRMLRRKKQ